MTATVTTESLHRTTVVAPPSTYTLDGGRCAAEVVLVAGGVAWWRARMRVVSARVVLGTPGSLVAQVSVRAEFASVPFTRRRLFGKLDETETALLTIADLPDLDAGSDVSVAGVVGVAERRWSVRLHLRVLALEPERLVLAITGSDLRDEGAPLVTSPFEIDVAAEFVRCE